MNLEELQRKLIAAARAHPPDPRVPYTFEKRVMASLLTRVESDPWALWSRALWRGAAVCLLLMLLLGALSVLVPRNNSGSNDLSQDFETAMLAFVDQDAETASFE